MIVMAGEPGFSVWPWITIAESELAVYVVPANVISGRAVGATGYSDCVVPRITATDAP